MELSNCWSRGRTVPGNPRLAFVRRHIRQAYIPIYSYVECEKLVASANFMVFNIFSIVARLYTRSIVDYARFIVEIHIM